PSPPALLTAATNSGPLTSGPMGALSTGNSIPKRSQSRVRNKVTLLDLSGLIESVPLLWFSFASLELKRGSPEETSKKDTAILVMGEHSVRTTQLQLQP